MDWRKFVIRLICVGLHLRLVLCKCPAGYSTEFMNGGRPSCLKLTNDLLTFDAARQKCQEDYGDLMIVNNISEASFASVYMIQHGSCIYAWAGMTFDGQWKSVEESIPPVFMTTHWEGVSPVPGEDYVVYVQMTAKFETRNDSALERGLCSRPPPVDGGWSSWSGLGPCGSGGRCRQRTCANPSPNYGGLACSGDDTDYPVRAYYTFHRNAPADASKKLTGFVLSELSGVSLLMCTISCSEAGTCMSVNYHAGDAKCELNSETATSRPASFVQSTGYTYYYLTTARYFS